MAKTLASFPKDFLWIQVSVGSAHVFLCSVLVVLVAHVTSQFSIYLNYVVPLV